MISKNMFVSAFKHFNFFKTEDEDFIDPKTGLIYHYEDGDIKINGVISEELYNEFIDDYLYLIVENDQTNLVFNDQKKYVELIIRGKAIEQIVELTELLKFIKTWSMNRDIKNTFMYHNEEENGYQYIK